MVAGTPGGGAQCWVIAFRSAALPPILASAERHHRATGTALDATFISDRVRPGQHPRLTKEVDNEAFSLHRGTKKKGPREFRRTLLHVRAQYISSTRARWDLARHKEPSNRHTTQSQSS